MSRASLVRRRLRTPRSPRGSLQAELRLSPTSVSLAPSRHARLPAFSGPHACQAPVLPSICWEPVGSFLPCQTPGCLSTPHSPEVHWRQGQSPVKVFPWRASTPSSVWCELCARCPRALRAREPVPAAVQPLPAKLKAILLRYLVVQSPNLCPVHGGFLLLCLGTYICVCSSAYQWSFPLKTSRVAVEAR